MVVWNTSLISESSPTSSAPVGAAAAAAASNSNRPSSGRIPVLFLLSVDNVGRLIGKQGRIINQIREAWPGASLVVHESETPAALHSQRERIVAVRPNLADDNNAIRDDMKSRNVEMMLAGICRRLCLPEEDFDPQRVEREIFRADSKVSSDTCCICLLIPGSTLPGMIGHEGQTVRSLQADTGCIIQFVTEPVVGTPNFRRCRITGCWPNLGRAVIAVVEKLQDLQDRGRAGVSFPGGWDPLTNPGRLEDTESATNSPSSSRDIGLPSLAVIEPSRFLVSPQEAAWLLGKSGRKINRLRDKYSPAVSINVDTVTPEWRVVSVGLSSPYSRSASLRKAHALLDLLGDLERYPTPAVIGPNASSVEANFFLRHSGSKMKVLIPPELFGAVMGRGGERMRRLTRATGAAIQKVRPSDSPLSTGDTLTESVIRRTLSSHRLIEISGTSKQKADAILRVVQIMDRKALDIAGIPDDDRDSSSGSPSVASPRPPSTSVHRGGNNSNGITERLSAFERSVREAQSMPQLINTYVTMTIVLPSLPQAQLLLAEAGGILQQTGCRITVGGFVPDISLHPNDSPNGRGAFDLPGSSTSSPSSSSTRGGVLAWLTGTPLQNTHAFFLIQQYIAATRMLHQRPSYYAH